ncbi:predicted protein [Verticillium alfalfae VaMs.102]|uniref:Predicted protein n=1 Tax=Verticillium alfalfae (strain VaMs.102 / ATCC MYA-4576 / FGSC 10136) TaxID=526221 RepID=C9SIZ8_VERA1|nr:predicted protein [Verticillium alfalfae VaMs.102]EEY18921.1 predicted protein [Verticillium alfalfae VaMs.102]
MPTASSAGEFVSRNASPEHASRYYSYSPGLVCSDAYETAGIFAMDGISASVTVVFRSTWFQDPEGGPTPMRTFDYFGETTTQTEDVYAAVTSGTIGRELVVTADGLVMEGDRIAHVTDEPLLGMVLAPSILMAV